MADNKKNLSPDFDKKPDIVSITTLSSNKHTGQLSEIGSNMNLVSDLTSIINKVRNLPIQPWIRVCSIIHGVRGFTAVDVSQNLAHLAYSFPHSHEIHLLARKSLSNDIARKDIITTWLNFKSARNQLSEVENREEKAKCLSSPQVYIFRHNNEISGLRFSLDDNFLLSCSLDGYVKAISTTTYQVLENYSGFGAFTDIDINSSTTQFATTSRLCCAPFHAVYVYDFERKDPAVCFYGHNNSLKCVRFHPNGLYIATAAEDSCIKLWSVHESKELRCFKDEGLAASPHKITFSPNGKYIASTHSGYVKIWDFASGKKIETLRTLTEPCHLNISFDHTGNMLAVGGSDKKIHIWNITSGESSEANPHYDLVKNEHVGKSIFAIKYAANSFYCVTG